jgi:hypothetical protein
MGHQDLIANPTKSALYGLRYIFVIIHHENKMRHDPSLREILELARQ